MDWKGSYQDTQEELEIARLREKELVHRVNAFCRVVHEGTIQSSGNTCHVPLDKSLQWYNKAVDDLTAIQHEITRLGTLLRDIETRISRLKGNYYRVTYLKHIKGYENWRIAETLGIEECTVRKYLTLLKRENKSQNVADQLIIS